MVSLYINQVCVGHHDRMPLPPWGQTRLFVSGNNHLQVARYELFVGSTEGFDPQEERLNLLHEAIASGVTAWSISGLDRSASGLFAAPVPGRLIVGRDFTGIRVFVLRNDDFGDLIIFANGDCLTPLRHSYGEVLMGEPIGRIQRPEGISFLVTYRIPIIEPPFFRTGAFCCQVPHGSTILAPTTGKVSTQENQSLCFTTLADQPKAQILMFRRDKEGTWRNLTFQENLMTNDGRVVVIKANRRAYQFRDDFSEPRVV